MELGDSVKVNNLCPIIDGKNSFVIQVFQDIDMDFTEYSLKSCLDYSCCDKIFSCGFHEKDLIRTKNVLIERIKDVSR